MLDWAIAQKIRQDNPIASVARALPKANEAVEHRPAVPHGTASEAVTWIRASNAKPVTKLLLEFQILTAVRPAEAEGARWADIDLDAAVWTLPATGKKERRSHRVPLSDWALAILGEARKLNAGELVFPVSAKPVRVLMGKLALASDQPGKQAVEHGFQSSFRDWAGELSGASVEVIGRAMAHKVSKAAEQAYARSDLLDACRQLMQAWVDYLTK